MKIYLDFEYNDEGVLAVAWGDGQTTKTAWRDFAPFLEDMERATELVSYAATAEAECLIKLGLNPLDYNWIDLHAEDKQVANGVDKHKKNRRLLFGVNSYLKAFNLAGAVWHHLGIDIDSEAKENARNRILKGGDFTQEEITEILEYAASDIKHLPALETALLQEYKELVRDKFKENARYNRGRWTTNLALFSGVPVNEKYMLALSQNADKAIYDNITDLCQKFPFYVIEDGVYVKKYSQLAKFVAGKKWAKTRTGKYRADREYLKANSQYPEIQALLKSNNFIAQMKWHRKKIQTKDGIIRTYLNPYGSQTGRCQPSSKEFIPLQSRWLKCLITPPKDYVLISADYISQEFLIAALYADDKEMLADYISGDPYLSFGKAMGIIPPDGTKKTHANERAMCKTTVLAMQYGQGAAAVRRLYGPLAYRIYHTHKHRHWQLHAFRNKIWRRYLTEKSLVLSDGWALGGNNMHKLSVQNFPSQGLGQVVLRAAVDKILRAKIDVCFTVHDAVVCMAHESVAAECQQMIDKLMREAAAEILGVTCMRVDSKIIRHGEDWVEDTESYNKYKKYLEII